MVRGLRMIGVGEIEVVVEVCGKWVFIGERLLKEGLVIVSLY